MDSSNRNERFDGSKAGTTGLHAPSLQKERKRKNSCSEVAQLKRQRKIYHKRKRSNDEKSEPDNHLTKKLETSEGYEAFGLKLTQHGVAYQLKLLMLFLKRAIDQGYPFRLATEMNEAEKFDDLVFQYKDGEKIAHRFLQAKHKINEAEKISIHDLLNDTDKKLNLQIYFLSYRKIKRNPKFNGMNNEIRDIIICTNIGFKWKDKLGALTLSEDIFHTKPDETILKTVLLRFKKKFDGKEEIVSVLENTFDLMKLAKNLVGRALDDKCTKMSEAEKNRSDACLKFYRFALLKEVIDGSSKKLRPKFVNREGLSPEAENFRQAIVKLFSDQIKTYNLHADPVIKDLDGFTEEVATLIEKGKDSRIIKIEKRKNVIKENFDKLAGHVLVKEAGKIRFCLAFLNEEDNNEDNKLLGNLDDFRNKLLVKLSNKNITLDDIAGYEFQVYKDFQTCDEIYVNEKIFWKVIGEKELDLSDNFCKWDANLESVEEFVKNLANLIEESRSNDKPKVEIQEGNDEFFKNMIKLAKYALIEENDTIRFSPTFLKGISLSDNLNEFRNKLKIQVGDLDELRFAINNFPKIRLPSESLTDIDNEIDGFLDKLLFAVDQPNEKSLSLTISDEIGNCRGINLMTTELQASYFQTYVYNWMKDKKGRFLTCVEGKDFFDKMEKEITTLQLSWLTRAYSCDMKNRDIRFIRCNEKLQTFLKPENISQLFILTSMPNTIFGLIQVHQIIETISDYKTDDSYIIIRLDSFLNMQGPVVDAFASQSKRLLIIECKSIKVNEQILRQNLEIMKSNDRGKIILITEKNDELVNQFKWMFDGEYMEEKVEVNSLLDFENESQDKIIEGKIVKFQGQEVPLCKLLIDAESKNLINAEALAKLINNETLEIGKPLEDLGKDRPYYISRTFRRGTKMNPSFYGDKSEFYVTNNNQLTDFDPNQHRDIVVISDNNTFFEQLRHNKNYYKHNIHWLKSENGQFIWQDSNGTVSNLRKFVDSDSVESFIPEKVTDISNKMVIIAAEPGMGKSTVLTYLSVRTNESEPILWVAKINLSVDCSKELEKMYDGIRFDDKKMMDFLLASAKLTSDREMLEYQFFNYCYKTGNMILLFDGFDEICPYYTGKVIALLKFLKGTRVKKIWVTTRPYNIKNNLEDKLGTFSYVLEEFSEADQRDFLMKFWTAKLKSHNFEEQRANEFISALLNSFSKSINDFQKKFISIPLQIRMIAEVFKDMFRNFTESNDENIADLDKKLEVNLELVSLYKKFFEVKISDIDFKEKEPGLDLTISRTKDRFERDCKHIVKIHEILSLENLYPNNSLIPRKKVIRLLKEVKRGENRTGIIDRVVDDKPVFVHKSFAEYFAALWFSKNKNWRKENVKQFLKKHIFSSESIVIRNLFDLILANKLESSESQEFSTEHLENTNVYKLYNAVLNNDESEVQKLLADDETLFHKTDAAKRNLLHLAAARGNANIARSFLEVWERADHKDATHPLSVKDELFQWTPLTYADKCHHWNVAELFLQTGVAGKDMFEAIKDIEISKPNDYNIPSLHRAARGGYLKIAELLLKEGAIINARDGTGRTPLLLAAQGSHLRIVQYFISQYHADSNDVDNSGETALHIAARIGNLEMVEYLIQKNANVEAVDKSGLTALHIAAVYNKPELAKYLIDEKKVNLEVVDKLGHTALHKAACYGSLEMIKYLVDEKNFNFEAVDKSGRTALFLAAEDGKLENVKYLADEKKANFEVVDESGNTVLHRAARFGHLEIIKYLVDEKKANFEAVNKSGETVLHMTATHGNLKNIKYLVDEKKANFEAADKSGLTGVHKTVFYGKLENVKYLIDEKKGNFEAAVESGPTALHVAARNGNLNLVKYLVDEKNANFEAAIKSGETVLHMAVDSRNLDLVKYLIDEKNANFEAADKLGRTALYMAAENGELEIVKYLVDEKKANFEIADKSGCTLMNRADLKGNLEVVKYLVNKKNRKNTNFEAGNGSV